MIRMIIIIIMAIVMAIRGLRLP